MTKFLFGTKEVVDLDGRTLCFFYYRIQTSTGYGIWIEDQDGTSTVIPGITTEADQVNNLLCFMMKGEVSPVSARDVVEDWLIV